MAIISFYGVIFALAFLAVFIMARVYLKNNKKDPELAYTCLIYLILGTISGARLVYVVYYSFPYFSNNLIEIFYVWNGGLSFHGGLLGAMLSGMLFCRRHKIDFLEIGDLLVIPASLFLSLGKIANFLNSELYGKITSLPWCIRFKGINGCRHPVQIYESIKNFFIFLLLLYLKSTKKLKKGVILLSFIFLYTFLRFFIDFFRYYETTYFGLGSGQFLNLLTFIISGYYLVKILNNKESITFSNHNPAFGRCQKS
jgi:phosphatidylglycerol---prolipoprotein diacylglyceryl transferase